MELAEFRKEIDIIDDSILSLFLRRMYLSEKIALYKKQHGIPILNQEREEEILSRMELCDEQFGGDARKLFSYIIELSRLTQEKLSS